MTKRVGDELIRYSVRGRLNWRKGDYTLGVRISSGGGGAPTYHLELHERGKEPRTIAATNFSRRGREKIKTIAEQLGTQVTDDLAPPAPIKGKRRPK